MKSTSNTSGNPLESNSVFISFLVLGALTIMLWQVHLATGEQSLGLLAFLTGMLATAVLICLFVLLALRCHASPTSPKVLAALTYTLQKDPDPRVRSKAAVGLAELELEQEKPSYHHEHNKLDDMLFEDGL